MHKSWRQISDVAKRLPRTFCSVKRRVVVIVSEMCRLIFFYFIFYFLVVLMYVNLMPTSYLAIGEKRAVQCGRPSTQSVSQSELLRTVIIIFFVIIVHRLSLGSCSVFFPPFILVSIACMHSYSSLLQQQLPAMFDVSIAFAGGCQKFWRSTPLTTSSRGPVNWYRARLACWIINSSAIIRDLGEMTNKLSNSRWGGSNSFKKPKKEKNKKEKKKA